MMVVQTRPGKHVCGPGVAFKVATRCVNFSSNWTKSESRTCEESGYVSLTTDLEAGG